jgi:hypothetical protein
MCDVMKERIREDRLDLAREAIIRGKYPLEEIAEIFELPLSDIENLEREISEEKASESQEG